MATAVEQSAASDSMSLSDHEKQLVVRSWRLVEPVVETMTELFYGHLFKIDPSLREMFPKDMSSQRRKIAASLAFVVLSLDWATSDYQKMISQDNDLFMVIIALGRRHRRIYHVKDSQYPLVGTALIWALEHALGPAFTPEVRSAWEKIYQLLSSAMILVRD